MNRVLIEIPTTVLTEGGRLKKEKEWEKKVANFVLFGRFPSEIVSTKNTAENNKSLFLLFQDWVIVQPIQPLDKKLQSCLKPL